MRHLDSLEESLGISFKERSLLRLAFVHSSYLNENPDQFPQSNERLEFLGDALIGLATAEELYRRYPDRPEGELTAQRSALVQGETLARIAQTMDLGNQLLMGVGEEASGGRERPSNLEATFEALVGALFLDQGYLAARTFVLETLADELLEADQRDPPKNPKSLLQELVQGDGGDAPSYRIVGVTGEDHARQFTAEAVVSGNVLGRGTGPRKSNAEQEAARNALKALGHDV